MKKGLIIAFVFLLGSFQAQDVSFSLIAKQNKALIGEPVQVNMLLTYPASYDESQVLLPLITDSTVLDGGIEVWETQPSTKKSETTNKGEYIWNYQQSFTVASFDSGQVDLGPLQAILEDDTVYSNSVLLLINPVEVDTTLDFKDIKTIDADPFTSWEIFIMWLDEHWPWVAVPILAILIIIVLYKILKDRPAREERKVIIPLHITLLNRLNQIRNNKIWQDGSYKQHFSDVTEVMQKYIAYRYNVPTLERTSPEILNALKLKAISEDDYKQIEKIFGLADMVKFAKTVPMQQENEQIVAFTEQFIRSTRPDENDLAEA